MSHNHLILLDTEKAVENRENFIELFLPNLLPNLPIFKNYQKIGNGWERAIKLSRPLQDDPYPQLQNDPFQGFQ